MENMTVSFITGNKEKLLDAFKSPAAMVRTAFVMSEHFINFGFGAASMHKNLRSGILFILGEGYVELENKKIIFKAGNDFRDSGVNFDETLAKAVEVFVIKLQNDKDIGKILEGFSFSLRYVGGATK